MAILSIEQRDDDFNVDAATDDDVPDFLARSLRFSILVERRKEVSVLFGNLVTFVRVSRDKTRCGSWNDLLGEGGVGVEGRDESKCN